MYESEKKLRRSVGSVRSKEAHQAILEAAKFLLVEKGYAGFSIEAVAKRANSSKPTIYRWWPNKAQLISEVYESEASQIYVPEGLSASKRIEFLLQELWKLWSGTICGEAFRCFIAESQNNRENMTLLREDFMQRRFALPREILLASIHGGELPQDTDVDLMLVTLFGFCWFHLLTDNLGDTSILGPFVHYLFSHVPLRSVG